jgi:MHS family proline/betaine transporter-like MFS transporter
MEHERARHNTPLRELLKRFPVQVLASTALVALWTVLWYVVLVYMSTYAIKVLKLPESNGMLAGMVGSLMVIAFCPVFGMLSDRFGRRIFHLGAAFLTCVLAYPMFWYLHAQPGLPSLLIFQIVFGLLIACYEGPLLATFSEVFPTRVRCTGISLVYNVGVIIFGGFAASIITWLIKYTSDPLAPAFYLIAAALLSLVGVLFLKGTRNEPEKSHSRMGVGINNCAAEA